MKSGDQNKESRKRVSLFPLSFSEAIDALLKVKPEDDRPAKQGKEKRAKPPKREQSDDD